MREQFEKNIRQKSLRLASLKTRTMELERKLADTRMSLERELAEFADGSGEGPGAVREGWHGDQIDDGSLPFPAGSEAWDDYEETDSACMDGGEDPDAWHANGGPDPGNDAGPAGERTEALIKFGRPSTYRSSRAQRRRLRIGIGVAAALTAATVATVVMLPGRPASWPAGVVAVQHEVAKACRNPNVKSEPDQVNFACARHTQRILWIFALMTSSDNPRFVGSKTGRRGLEPITPAQGGALALSLNLHHPYSPFNATDSIEVAARAINNIIGGATITGSGGKTVVQPGLESSPGNCARYTGSPAVISRRGFPEICAKPMTTAAGRAALVADVYRRWIVGATAGAIHDVTVLFDNANDPGNPRVQAILRHLPTCGC